MPGLGGNISSPKSTSKIPEIFFFKIILISLFFSYKKTNNISENSVCTRGSHQTCFTICVYTTLSDCQTSSGASRVSSLCITDWSHALVTRPPDLDLFGGIQAGVKLSETQNPNHHQLLKSNPSIPCQENVQYNTPCCYQLRGFQ